MSDAFGWSECTLRSDWRSAPASGSAMSAEESKGMARAGRDQGKEGVTRDGLVPDPVELHCYASKRVHISKLRAQGRPGARQRKKQTPDTPSQPSPTSSFSTMGGMGRQGARGGHYCPYARRVLLQLTLLSPLRFSPPHLELASAAEPHQAGPGRLQGGVHATVEPLRVHATSL